MAARHSDLSLDHVEIESLPSFFYTHRMIHYFVRKCNCVAVAIATGLEFFAVQSCSIVNVQSRHQSRVAMNYSEAWHSSAE